jgi:2-aminoadipate transaminase
VNKSKDPFYINKTETPAMRLNFSCVDEETIQEGIRRLGKSIKKLLLEYPPKKQTHLF